MTVFCGSAPGKDPQFQSFAREVGSLLARLNLDLIYGGSKDGCMGAVADGCLSSGGRVIGILPQFFMEWEIQHPNLSEIIFTENMASRKELLIAKGDVVLVLPGGFGTLDEFFEVLTLSSLKRIEPKAAILFDPLGFFDGLVNWLENIHLAGFTREPGQSYSVIRELSELETFLSGPHSVCS